MNEIKIDIMPISELKPYEKNARKHQSEDVGAIVASIKEFGFNDPIGVWSDENIIVEGHGRLEAAKALGLEVVPVIHLDHLTDEQRRAYALAHNKTAELSLWDFELLDIELDNILDIDMSDFGFADRDLSLLDEMGEDLVENHNNDVFDMTLTMPIEYKDKIEQYIKDNTKKPFVELIIKEVENA